MQKLYTDLIGTPVYEEYSPASPLTYVRDLIIDPETGKLLAFLVKNSRIIVPADISYINSALFIPDRDRIIHFSEVLRVADVLKKRITLWWNRFTVVEFTRI